MTYQDEKHIQIEYILQLTDRLKEDLYDKGQISIDGRKWHKIDYYHSLNHFKTTCDYVKENNKRCGKKLHNIFVVQNTETKEILKIGSTCSKKLLGINSTMTIQQLDEKIIEIQNTKDQLLDFVETTNKVMFQTIKQYTQHDKMNLIYSAIEEGILTYELKVLLRNSVPLTNNQCLQLEKNLYKLKNEKENLSSKINHEEEFSSLIVFPEDPIYLILEGTGITNLNETTKESELMIIIKNLIDYLKSTSIRDKRKTVNYKEIINSIDRHYVIEKSIKNSLNRKIFDCSLNYLSSDESKYRPINIDYDNRNFIFTYI